MTSSTRQGASSNPDCRTSRRRVIEITHLGFMYPIFQRNLLMCWQSLQELWKLRKALMTLKKVQQESQSERSRTSSRQTMDWKGNLMKFLRVEQSEWLVSLITSMWANTFFMYSTSSFSSYLSSDPFRILLVLFFFMLLQQLYAWLTPPNSSRSSTSKSIRSEDGDLFFTFLEPLKKYYLRAVLLNSALKPGFFFLLMSTFLWLLLGLISAFGSSSLASFYSSTKILDLNSLLQLLIRQKQGLEGFYSTNLGFLEIMPVLRMVAVRLLGKLKFCWWCWEGEPCLTNEMISFARFLQQMYWLKFLIQLHRFSMQICSLLGAGGRCFGGSQIRTSVYFFRHSYSAIGLALPTSLGGFYSFLLLTKMEREEASFGSDGSLLIAFTDSF